MQSSRHDKGQDKCQSRSRNRSKNKNLNKVAQSDSDNGQFDDSDETKLQEYNNVEILYYHDVVIHSSEQAKCRLMYNLKRNFGTKSCLNQCKVDTVVDGNLFPIGVYKHLGGNVCELAKSIDKSMRLIVYNKTKIRQYGVCHIMVQFKTKQLEAKFFVVDQTTVLIGLSDSIRLGLIMVNCFNSLHSVSTDEIEVDYHDNNNYFTGKTDMKCQIN